MSIHEQELILLEIQYKSKLYSVIGWTALFLIGILITTVLVFSPVSELAILAGFVTLIPLVALANTWLASDGGNQLSRLHNRYLKGKMEYEKGKSQVN